MNDKSHVSMEQRNCVVCGKVYDTGAILLDRRLRASLEARTVTGWGLCPEHAQMNQDGFVALVECDPEKSEVPDGGGLVEPGQAYRTGVVTFLKREVFNQMFDRPGIDEATPCIFVEPAVTQLVKSRVASLSH